MTLLFSLITVQTILGAFDNLWHHTSTWSVAFTCVTRTTGCAAECLP